MKKKLFTAEEATEVIENDIAEDVLDTEVKAEKDVNNTFTLRDFDSKGEVHTVMRCHYDKRGTFRQAFLIPLKAGTYRYCHGGVGTLNVYMNRRDFA